MNESISKEAKEARSDFEKVLPSDYDLNHPLLTTRMMNQTSPEFYKICLNLKAEIDIFYDVLEIIPVSPRNLDKKEQHLAQSFAKTYKRYAKRKAAQQQKEEKGSSLKRDFKKR